MVGLTGIKVYVANFYDTNGEYVGSKRISVGFFAPKKLTFNFMDGTYNYNPLASRSRACTFPWLVDYYFQNYILYNPDPVQLSFPELKIPFLADQYNVVLKSDILRKLNNVRQGGLLGFLTWRNLVIIAVGIAIVYYFSSGGTIAGLSEPATQGVTAVAGDSSRAIVSGGRGS